MTDPAHLQAYAALGGVAVALVGVVFVIFQLRGLEKTIRTAAHVGMYEQAANFRAHLVIYPHLRKYFFDGARLAEDTDDYERAITIAELYLNYIEHVAVTVDSFGRANRTDLERFIRISLQRSPLLAERLAAIPDNYNHALRRYLA